MENFSELSDSQLCKMIDSRWKSSGTLWDEIDVIYKKNISIYKNKPSYLAHIPKKKSKVRANRIFVNMEAVINSVISREPKPIILNGRDTPEAKALSSKLEKYFQSKYRKLNVKESMRKGLRNLYFGRLIVLKPFWNPRINDFDVRVIDPRKIRISSRATHEEDSDFAIEEVTDTISAIIQKFPSKKDEILKMHGYETETDASIENKEIRYFEAWIYDYVVFKMGNIILGKISNPYWDWDGILITNEEEIKLQDAEGEARRDIFLQARLKQEERKNAQMILKTSGEMPLLEGATVPLTLSSYRFNHFDHPRKPYILSTLFNNSDSPVGETDMITQAAPLQQNIDETKSEISMNAKLVNGLIKVDSTVMDKADAQRMRFETDGIIWGKGVVAGVQRETGPALPAFVVANMEDSRREIDDIMAASSAFKGVRQGQETRGGRLALIDQSFLRLNEMVQVIDYVNYELFNWFYQLAKVRYTEHHYAKTMGKTGATEILSIIRDDFQNGTEIRIIGGKTLPEDRQFKYEQAQGDVEKGLLSPVDYFQVAGYDSPSDKARNRVIYELNKPFAVGIPQAELDKIQPHVPNDPPKLSIAYTDLPIDGRIQMAAKAGIQLNPKIAVAEQMAINHNKNLELTSRMGGVKIKPVNNVPAVKA